MSNANNRIVDAIKNGKIVMENKGLSYTAVLQSLILHEQQANKNPSLPKVKAVGCKIGNGAWANGEMEGKQAEFSEAYMWIVDGQVESPELYAYIRETREGKNPYEVLMEVKSIEAKTIFDYGWAIRYYATGDCCCWDDTCKSSGVGPEPDLVIHH